jgi:hypothetical protein
VEKTEGKKINAEERQKRQQEVKASKNKNIKARSISLTTLPDSKLHN